MGEPIPDTIPEGNRQPRRVAQVRSARSVVCRIKLLDNTLFQTDVDKRAFGQILFDKTCEHLDLLEKDYFGLSFTDPATGLRNWLNNEKKISKQMKGLAWEFNFEVKFYPSDPQQLHEDLTRYQLCLQIRNDIVTGRLPCSFVTYALLGSYTVQSELGDFEVEEFGPGTEYIRKMKFAPRQDRELLKKIAELHKTHRGQTPEEAELHFLENAKKLTMYGVDICDGRDGENVEIQLGICASGIIVFREKLQINKFVWPKIIKMSYRRKKFYIKLRSGEFEDFQSLIAFKFAHVKLAKRLWKVCVENHAFFRNREPDSPSQRRGFMKLGSKFRYSGRTQFQTRQAMAAVDRPSPYFDRVLSKRATYHGKTTNKNIEDEFYRPRPAPEPRHHHPPPPRIEEHFIDRKPVHHRPVQHKPVPEPEIKDDQESLSGEEEQEPEEEPADRKSRMEKIHAVPTPLAAVMFPPKKEEHPVENNNVERPSRRRKSYDEESIEKPPLEEEMERSRQEPSNTEPHPPLEQAPPPQTFDPPKLLSKEERKRREKEEKELKKRQKDEEKKKKKEEERERKRIEKEKKKTKGKKEIGKEWQEAVAVAVTDEVINTEERREKPRRMSSFEEQKHEEQRHESDSEAKEKDDKGPPPMDRGGNSSDRDEPKSDEASGSNSERDDDDDDEGDDRSSNPNLSARVGEEFDL